MEENPDREIARDSVGVMWTAARTLAASIGIFLVFAFRSTFGCEPKTPQGIIFKWYGNHCGPGYGEPDSPPIDELDELCRQHDISYRSIEKP